MPLLDSLESRAMMLFNELDSLPIRQRIEAINRIRLCLHEHSPFAAEPVDCVQWVPGERIEANDYNPNSVAPPEMIAVFPFKPFIDFLPIRFVPPVQAADRTCPTAEKPPST